MHALNLVTRLDPRYLRLLCGGTLLVLCAALLSYVVVPQLKAYRSALGARDAVRSESDTETLEKGLAARAEAIEALKRKLHGDMADIPPRQMEAFVVGRLQRISWRHDVELVSVQPSTGDLVQGFEELLFEVELAGHYFDLFAWLWAMHRELGFVVVKEYAMERVKTSSEEPRLKAKMTLASYRTVRS